MDKGNNMDIRSNEKGEVNAVTSSQKATYGSRQWAKVGLNFMTGCPNGCLYCYAREMAVRYGHCTPESWINGRVRDKDLKKKIKRYDNIVMFPSSHDIRPEHLEESLTFLQHILEAGNKVLIVSKPFLRCIQAISERFKAYTAQIVFRFTIGSTDDSVLKFWEPNAPSFNERLEALKWAFNAGFTTSVSCEPMLDNNIERVIDAVNPYVNETIWLGKANHLLGEKGRGRLEMNGVALPEVIAQAKELIGWQSDDNILALYDKYKDNPMIRWKDSIERVVKRTE